MYQTQKTQNMEKCYVLEGIQQSKSSILEEHVSKRAKEQEYKCWTPKVKNGKNNYVSWKEIGSYCRSNIKRIFIREDQNGGTYCQNHVTSIKPSPPRHSRRHRTCVRRRKVLSNMSIKQPILVRSLTKEIGCPSNTPFYCLKRICFEGKSIFH